ncbi:hypothetical protein [Algoriphagus confluentis]
MDTFKRYHFISGSLIAIFVFAHMINHLISLWGPSQHLEMMEVLRKGYRVPVLESLLIILILIQVITGIRFLRVKRNWNLREFQGIQSWSGLYLLFFLSIHICAVFAGRFILELDTNFYFGVAGLNSFPVNIFFIPYYGLAIIAFFAHLSSIHNKKMKVKILAISPLGQARLILAMGILFSLLIIFGLTNHFRGFEIPKEYRILTGEFDS